jgi:type II secretory pathway component PulF
VLYYIGVFDRIARSYREKTLFSNTSLAFVYPVIVIFIGMGISKFKLPQYIIPIFPLTALFLASWIDRIATLL